MHLGEKGRVAKVRCFFFSKGKSYAVNYISWTLVLYFLDKLPVQVSQTCFVYWVAIGAAGQITAVKLTYRRRDSSLFA